MEITVAVAHKELTFADALAIRLDTEDDITVVAVTQTGWRPVPGHQPDVVLLDAGLVLDRANHPSAVDPGFDGSVVVLGSTWELARVAAVQVGAPAWVGNDDSVEHLLRVLRGVARVGTRRPAAQSNALTPRERQVLTCLADGAGRSEVAARLNVSENTVRTHLRNLMAKLGVHSSVEAVAAARGQTRPRR